MGNEDNQPCTICKKPALMKCSACKTVWYCGKDHQKQDWKTHKLQCRPFEISKSSEMGRFLVATRDLAPGDLILTEPPLVFGPRPYPIEEGPIPCVGCCKLIPPDSSTRCSNCNWPICDPSCLGIRNPLAHGQECPILCLRPPQVVGNPHDFYRQDVLFALRCLLLQRSNLKKWKQMFDMESHFDKRGKETDIFKSIKNRVVNYLLDNYINPLKEFEAKSNNVILHDSSEETIHRICAIIDVNALECSQNIELSGLYPTAALMEHNCISNTFHYFGDDVDQYKITVRAACPIKKGEHITTMYTHALWGTKARLEHLKETKYFSCKCKRCSDPTELGTFLSGMRCLGTQNVLCGGTQLPVSPLEERTEWSCDKCPVRVSDENVANIVNQIGDEVDNIQTNKPTVKELENLLEKMLTFLHPNHYHVYSVKHSLLQLYGYQQGYLPNQLSDDLLQKKVDMCKELLGITKKLDPGNSRLSLYTGVILHELHLATMDLIKRQWNTGDQEKLITEIRDAKGLLIMAQDVLINDINAGTGVKLHDLICSSIRDLNRWLDAKEIEI